MPPSAGAGRPRGRRVRPLAWAAAIAVALAAGWLVWHGVEAEALRTAWRTALADPATLAAVLAVYAGAFLLRALAWRRVLPTLSLGHALAGVHVSLGGNHILPLRLGEPLRVTSVVRRAGVPVDAAVASTVTLRAADVLALAVLAAVVAPTATVRVAGVPGLAVTMIAAAGIVAAGLVWLRRQARRKGAAVRSPGLAAACATTLAWALEAVVIWQVARWAGVSLEPAEALLVTVVAVIGQLAAVAPSGFGTYEAAGTAALVGIGVDAGTGLAIVLSAHALKTAYALSAGLVGALLPSPGLLGRLRLPQRGAMPGADREIPRAARGEAVGPDRPVVLFMPAHDEAATVAEVVARVPATVAGHPVRCLVVDDGSTDDTARLAADQGAEVRSLRPNRGLGAAVREGLRAATRMEPAAVAFCDADGEYAPEELERLVAPILRGQADYVVGSRFSGDIRHMRPHRRLGNVVLTRLVAYVARERITDGQSGYRALSPAAAAGAEVVHDYNYAQVLTLDLLAKGFRYAEVPITYHFRTEGRSFIRLGRYLRAVVPAVWQVTNRPGPAPADAVAGGDEVSERGALATP